MIQRHWTCVAHPELADTYERHLRTEIFPQLAELQGFVSATILRREFDEGSAFRIVTEWTSLQAVRGFAGENVEAAVVPDEVQAMMLRFDERVAHYVVRERVEGKG